MTPLSLWQNFYVILGSAAGALVGLQFVAMALIADLSVTPGEEQTGQEEVSATFSTPTIVHFTCVLLLTASMVMPWHQLTAVAAIGACIGAFGVVYMIGITLRMRRQTAYQSVWEDWLFRSVLPIVAYLALGVTAISTGTHPRCLFGIAASALLLLIMGIHNAWDNVTYIVAMKRRDAGKK